jgi:hypothetical protein
MFCNIFFSDEAVFLYNFPLCADPCQKIYGNQKQGQIAAAPQLDGNGTDPHRHGACGRQSGANPVAPPDIHAILQNGGKKSTPIQIPDGEKIK